MAAITWTNVTDVTADLAAVSVPAQNAILLMVNEALDVRLFGNGEADNRLFLARVYLAAHYGAVEIAGSNGPAGPLVSESAGGLASAYAVPESSGDPALDTTSWGRAYKLLTRPMGGGVVL